MNKEYYYEQNGSYWQTDHFIKGQNIPNICDPDDSASECMKQKLVDLKGSIGKSFIVIDRTKRKTSGL